MFETEKAPDDSVFQKGQVSFDRMKNVYSSNYSVSHDKGEGNRRAEAFFDAGTFVEIGAHIRRDNDPASFEGVVTGYGAVDGRLVFGFFQDNSRMKGAIDAQYGRKIEQIYALAVRNGAPIVGVLDSAGAVIYDGAASMAAYGKWMKAAAKASGVIPQITVIDGICAGSAAMAAAMTDFVIAAKDKAEIYLSPVASSDSEGADTAGFTALEAENEAAAFASARTLLSLLPQNNAEGTVSVDCADDMNRIGAWVKGDVDASLAAIADNGEFYELYGDFGRGIKTGFMTLSGTVVGVIAGNASVDGGAIGADEAKKSARLVSFCDSFGIPVLNLVDSVGLKKASAPETAQAFAALAGAFAGAECPIVTAIVGKAYGVGFTLGGSKVLGADIVFALPDASIGLLSPEASVAFVWNDRVSEDVSREALESEWKEAYASPAEAACRGEVDDVIAPEELRARLSAAVSMLISKSVGLPDRRHPVLPL